MRGVGAALLALAALAAAGMVQDTDAPSTVQADTSRALTDPEAETAATTCAVKPLSEIEPLRTNERYGVVSIPKTGTTSLGELIRSADMHICCGGALWQKGIQKSKTCPRSSLGTIKLQPYHWDRGFNPKRLNRKHLLHTDWLEINVSWIKHQTVFSKELKGGTLRTAVLLRDPLDRLYSAYVHGKQWNVRNKIHAGDKIQNRGIDKRMHDWRSFYWSYRDVNNSVLEKTLATNSFAEFAAIRELPLHNQQTRMMVGARAVDFVDADMSQQAQTNLCAVECVGVLEHIAPFLKCVAKQLGLHDHNLVMPKANTIKREWQERSSPITPKSRQLTESNSWSDYALYRHADQLSARREGGQYSTLVGFMVR